VVSLSLCQSEWQRTTCAKNATTVDAARSTEGPIIIIDGTSFGSPSKIVSVGEIERGNGELVLTPMYAYTEDRTVQTIVRFDNRVYTFFLSFLL